MRRDWGLTSLVEWREEEKKKGKVLQKPEKVGAKGVVRGEKKAQKGTLCEMRPRCRRYPSCANAFAKKHQGRGGKRGAKG